MSSPAVQMWCRDDLALQAEAGGQNDRAGQIAAETRDPLRHVKVRNRVREVGRRCIEAFAGAARRREASIEGEKIDLAKRRLTVHFFQRTPRTKKNNFLFETLLSFLYENLFSASGKSAAMRSTSDRGPRPGACRCSPLPTSECRGWYSDEVARTTPPGACRNDVAP